MIPRSSVLAAAATTATPVKHVGLLEWQHTVLEGKVGGCPSFSPNPLPQQCQPVAAAAADPVTAPVKEGN